MHLIDAVVDFKDGCPKIHTHDVIFSEKRAKYEAKNLSKKQVCEITIDKGLIKDNVAKCDKGIWLDEEKKLYLIELKGKNLDHACEQIVSTSRILNKKFNCNFRIVARIVLTRTPSNKLVHSVPNLKTKEKELKKISIDYKWKSSPFIDSIG